MSGSVELSNADPLDFVRLLAPAVREAAALVRSLEGRVANLPKGNETGAVKQALTEADTAAQELLLEALEARFPRVQLEAEEDTPRVARFPSAARERVVIDPIDGTLRFYLEAAGPYAVMVGLVVDGYYRAGLVALPREGLLVGGSAATALRARAGGPLRPVRAEADGDLVLVSHSLAEASRRHLEARGYRVRPACGGAISVAPLLPGVCAGLRHQPRRGAEAVGVSIRGRIGVVVSRGAGALARGDHGADFPEDAVTASETLRLAADEERLAVLDEALDAAGLA